MINPFNPLEAGGIMSSWLSSYNFLWIKRIIENTQINTKKKKVSSFGLRHVSLVPEIGWCSISSHDTNQAMLWVESRAKTINYCSELTCEWLHFNLTNKKLQVELMNDWRPSKKSNEIKVGSMLQRNEMKTSIHTWSSES